MLGLLIWIPIGASFALGLLLQATLALCLAIWRKLESAE